jgi:hypothetical protein
MYPFETLIRQTNVAKQDHEEKLHYHQCVLSLTSYTFGIGHNEDTDTLLVKQQSRV